MIKKCDHPGCTKAGVCRAPKTRDLKEYWMFCKEHAAEYNKNWNYYANMTPDEIEEDWEHQTFGKSRSKNTKQDQADYIKFLNDFISGRDTFDKMPAKKSLPSETVAAFKTLELPITASWREIGAKYRALAKKYHPDSASSKSGNAEKFAKISSAYQHLKRYFAK